ncbi:cytochrome P450 [Kibdelosporangium persicum]|uniref:Pentalenolactone synthase n=2 Tax=Kibdelosporangium persicum TaxID=2698649 RepID=A0ABX2FJT7_9PSEU|nr:Pentalenolactone synthase [Kibdelosporangium persicum]
MDTTVSLPFERTHPLRIPPLLRELQGQGPVHRVRTAVGDPGWLVTDYAEVKRLLASDKLGRSHPDPENAARIGESALVSGPLGDYETEPADSARTRALLQPHFSPKRMRVLRERVDELTTALMDDLARQAHPVDFIEALALPLPILVVCELLGVPYEEREQFRAWIHAAADVTDRAGSEQALGALFHYGQQLVARKHETPGDDITSRLCQTEGVSDEEVALLTMALLFAGFETTSVHIGLGLLLFLVNRDQWQAIVDDPALIPSAIDEMIRATPGPAGGDIPRYARTDIEIGPVLIKAGDLVLLDNGAANHDPAAFPEPDRFDVTRPAGAHLSFGHGPHYCIGAPLAKVELEAVFTQLVRRFPDLRLAVELDELRMRANTQTGGLVDLPVTW